MERVLPKGVSVVLAGVLVGAGTPIGPIPRPFQHWHGAIGQGVSGTADFGTLGSGPISSDSDSEDTTVLVYPDISLEPDGSTVSTYVYPDGSTMVSVSPPPGFDPLSADPETLTEYGFPLPPSDPVDYQAWHAAMAAFRSDPPATSPDEFVVDPADTPADFATEVYHNWAGYIIGAIGTDSHTYVAVKGNLVVPTNASSCNTTNAVGYWIGLGGTFGQYSGHNLVQQGFACGKTSLGGLAGYHPFTQFANTQKLAKKFCDITSWVLTPDDVIYQNMSFQTSQNKAFFYFEDQTSGVANNCSRTPPAPPPGEPPWHWDLNTAEWIAEASGVDQLNPPVDATLVNFHSVRFTNARAQLYSNSNWVTLASQQETLVWNGTEYIPGLDWHCIDPGAIGSDGASFTATWLSSTCYDPDP